MCRWETRVWPEGFLYLHLIVLRHENPLLHAALLSGVDNSEWQQRAFLRAFLSVGVDMWIASLHYVDQGHSHGKQPDVFLLASKHIHYLTVESMSTDKQASYFSMLPSVVLPDLCRSPLAKFSCWNLKEVNCKMFPVPSMLAKKQWKRSVEMCFRSLSSLGATWVWMLGKRPPYFQQRFLPPCRPSDIMKLLMLLFHASMFLDPTRTW